MTNFIANKTIYLKKGTILISLILLLSSFTQNAFYVGSKGVHSLFAFLFGFFVVMGTGISWLANPLLISSWLLVYKNTRYSQYLSIFAVLLSLSFLLLTKVVTNEGGYPNTISSYGAGYWLWFSSCIVNCIGIFIIRKLEEKVYEIQ